MSANAVDAIDTAYLQLLNGSGALLTSNVNNDVAQFNYTPTTTATYYLMASEQGNDSIGSYSISTSVI